MKIADHHRRLLWGLFSGIFFVFFAVRAWKAGDNDFIAYYQAGKRALAGENLYQTETTPFRYLPFTAYFFAPLTLFGLKTARFVFFLLNFAAVFRIYASIRGHLGDFAALALLVLFARFHNHDFQNAQINPLLLLLFFYWLKNRPLRTVLPSFAFALFACFKLVPFALGLPLLLLGRWRELFTIGAWVIVFNLTSLWTFDDGFEIFRQWYAHARQIEYPAVTLPNVQSLQSALWWWTREYWNPASFAFFVHFLQFGLLFGCWAMVPHETKDREKWILSAGLAAAVLISPLAWKHNYLQFLPFAVLGFTLDPSFRSRGLRWIYGIALAGMVVLPSVISAWSRPISDRMYLLPWTGLFVVFFGIRLGAKYSRSKNGVDSYPRPVGERD